MSANKKNITLSIIGIGLLTILAFVSFKNSNLENETNETSNLNPTLVIQDVFIPDSISIFKEKVPVKQFDVRESLERELLVNMYFQSQTVQYVKYVHRFFPIIDSILQVNDIPSDFKYLALAESGLKINISPKGAAGYWQFLESTAKEQGLLVTEEIDQRYDLIKSTEAACKYLKTAYKRFNSWTLVAASYNIGMGGLRQQLNYQDVNSYYDLHTNSETGRYVYRIISFKLILEQPEKYGYNKLTEYPKIPYSVITVDSTISNLATFAFSQGTNYKMLKLMNPWLRGKTLPNASKTSYKILIVKNEDRTINTNN